MADQRWLPDGDVTVRAARWLMDLARFRHSKSSLLSENGSNKMPAHTAK